MLSIIDKKDSYGYEINKEIENMTKGSFIFTEATLYTSFKRLSSFSYITSYWSTESGKKRKYYKITDLGKEKLEAMKNEWLFLEKLINNIIK